MTKKLIQFSRETEAFYREFAAENHIDYHELCLLDLLMLHGGAMTWNAIAKELPFSRSTLLRTAQALEKELVLSFLPDGIEMTDYGFYALSDFIAAFREQLMKTSFARREREACLQA